MKRKTAVKRLMSMGYSRNQANMLMLDKSKGSSNKGRYAVLGYAASLAWVVGIPIGDVESIQFEIYN
ncbi:MAG: hypothetical protein J6K94_03990 [Ruminiclostridium sp.]|nr:hypothetical protein [Ruminiclostridium sp.]